MTLSQFSTLSLKEKRLGAKKEEHPSNGSKPAKRGKLKDKKERKGKKSKESTLKPPAVLVSRC